MVNEDGKYTKMDDLTVKKLEEAFAIDSSIEEACFYAGITRQTYYNWIDKNEAMKERFDGLRQKPFLKARQTIINNLDSPKYALAYMERKRPDEFGNRANINLTNIQTDEELDTKRKQLNDLLNYVKTTPRTISEGKAGLPEIPS